MSSAEQRRPHQSTLQRRTVGIAVAIAAVVACASSITWAERASAQETADLKVDPASATVAVDAETTVKIMQNAGVITLGVESDISFDENVLQIVSVEKGAAYATGASFVSGVAPQTKDEAIATANSTGELLNVATFFAPGAGEVAAGQQEAFVIKFKGKGDGTTPVKLSGTSMLDSSGLEIQVNVTDGQVTVGAGGAVSEVPTPAPPGGGAPPASAPPASSGSVAGESAAPPESGKGAPVAGFGPLPGDSSLWMLWVGAAALIIVLLASGAVSLRGTRRS